eukprot:UN26884
MVIRTLLRQYYHDFLSNKTGAALSLQMLRLRIDVEIQPRLILSWIRS